METAAAGDGFLRGNFESCISGADMSIDRRPYHKNCGCALHNKSRGGHCHHSSRHNKISYPIRRSWSEGCLTLIGKASPGCSPSPTEAAGICRTQTQLVLYQGEEAEGDEGASTKV